MSEPTLYEVTDLWKTFTSGDGLVEVLRGIDFSVKRGESVAVRGPSGVGKSTLMHILGLLDSASKGAVTLDGIDVLSLSDQAKAKIRNKRIGFVFQFFQLLPEFTALENIVMPALIAGLDLEKIRDKALDLLREVGLSHRSSHRPGELSGGEQQRVAIARALIMDPDVVLADEPTGNLDPTKAEEIESLLTNLNRSRITTLIVVTHKESLAQAMDRRVGLVAGKLVELQ